jgi:hypothetical protein
MRNNFTNLVPPERRHALRRDHYLRLSVTAGIFITLLVIAAILLLIPTYVLLTESIAAKQEHITIIESSPSSNTEKTLTARLQALNSSSQTLAALEKIPSASGIIRQVLGVSRPNITLYTFAYTPPGSKTPGTLVLSGKARSREALRNYQLALQSASFVKSADLPVSAYAQDSDISFTITVTLAL